MSDTPRTDLMEKVAQPYSWQASYIRAADFARELERENAKLCEALRKIGSINAHLYGAAFRMQEAAREALGEN